MTVGGAVEDRMPIYHHFYIERHGGQVSQTLDAVLSKGQAMPEKNRFPAVLQPVTHSLHADGFDASEDGTGRGTPLLPAIAPCLTGNYGKQPDNSDTSKGPLLIPV